MKRTLDIYQITSKLVIHDIYMLVILTLYIMPLGATRSHTDAFKRIRDQRIDHFVVETNKLLIRLDKLVGNDAPLEPGKRKGTMSIPL